ncbi:MAG: hypothetical protein V3W52_17335 [Syntrophobacteria bacterium]
MARTPQNFTNTTQLSSAAADIVTDVPSDTFAVVRKLSFRNTGATTRSVTVYVLASAGTAGITNELAVKAIPPGKEWNVILIQGEVLDEGMSVQAKQDAGTDVNANCSGTLIT